MEVATTRSTNSDSASQPRVLLFLHGRPAVGKHTVARYLAEHELLQGFHVYHNHDVVDRVLSQHAFGSEEFVRERDALWRQQLSSFLHGSDSASREASLSNRKGLIFTFNPENTVPQLFLDWLFEPRSGVRVVSVALVATEPDIIGRLDSEERKRFHKLKDAALYQSLVAAGAFDQPTIPRTDLLIDTSTMSVADAANRIAAFVTDRL